MPLQKQNRENNKMAINPSAPGLFDACCSSDCGAVFARLNALDNDHGADDRGDDRDRTFWEQTTNVTPSAEINNTSTTYSIHTAGDEFQLEITSRAAGIIETEDITRTIETTSTTTSLSVFSK